MGSIATDLANTSLFLMLHDCRILLLSSYICKLNCFIRSACDTLFHIKALVVLEQEAFSLLFFQHISSVNICQNVHLPCMGIICVCLFLCNIFNYNMSVCVYEILSGGFLKIISSNLLGLKTMHVINTYFAYLEVLKSPCFIVNSFAWTLRRGFELVESPFCRTSVRTSIEQIRYTNPKYPYSVIIFMFHTKNIVSCLYSINGYWMFLTNKRNIWLYL